MNNHKTIQPKTLLGYELTLKQHIVVNYLIPSLGSCVLYMFLIACDIAVIYRHYKEDNPVWSSLTLLFLYLPALGSYVVILSSLELWPQGEGCGSSNIVWAVVKTLEHALFPVWSMWRYAERIFWAIEGISANHEGETEEILNILDAPRSIELYVFLQSYLHSLPQILLQIFILMRHEKDINRQTVGAEVLSILLNLMKVAVTTAFFQRFKTQKLAGKHYPWFKAQKQYFDYSVDSPTKATNVETQNKNETKEKDPLPSHSTPEEDPNDVTLRVKQPDADQTQRPNRSTLRRSSSDFYLQPSSSFIEDTQELIKKHIVEPVKHFNRVHFKREPSVLDVPDRLVLHEPDFNITRLKPIKALPEDDIAGKLISFCWWFCFLLARILAISAFFYFYPKECVFILIGHFIVVLSILVYDVKTGDLERSKITFFLFIGFIYLFCIIEFKIRFKKAKIIYYGFFSLVYIEDFTMCLVWWFSDIEIMQEDFWFRYVFVIIVMASIFSLTAMLFYLNVNKPEKIVVGSEPKK